ncbi:MAG: alpha/beta hydrolase [Leptospiraceae bacterium]|nr:alpha/beta hydrolase [Leptospiraceae bacterium]
MRIPENKKSATIGSVTLTYLHQNPPELQKSGGGALHSATLTEIPLVLLHGWPEGSHSWQGVVDSLLATGFSRSILCVDLKGLGHSSRSLDWKTYKKQTMASEVKELLDQLQIPSFDLVGHDWGGVVAQEMAIQWPEKVRKLVISNISLITHLDGLRKGREAKQGIFDVDWYQSFQQTDLPAKLVPGNEEAFLRYFLRSPESVPAIPEESIQQSIDCYRIQGTPAAASYWYRTLPYDTRRWLTLRKHRFEMPTLLLYGNKDPVINMDYVHGFEVPFPRGSLVELDAGHFCHEERPQEFAAELLGFLQS